MSDVRGCVLLVLAGGQGRRMGGVDKPLSALCGRPLLAHVLASLGQSPDATLLSVNVRPERYQAFGVTLLPDGVTGLPGPLAGILAGLEWIASREPDADLLVVPGDTPFLPHDLLARLQDARAGQDAQVACAGSGGRLHPVVGLWRARHVGAVREALAARERRLGRVMHAIGLAVAEFGVEPVDPFFNVNTPEDLAKAELLCRVREARPEALPLDSAKGSPLGSLT